MAHISVRFRLAGADPEAPLVGRLWDISPQGACVAIPGPRLIAVPVATRLLISDPVLHEKLELSAELRWCTPLSHTTFVGMVFLDGELPAKNFLMTYMRRTWTDSVPRSNLEL